MDLPYTGERFMPGFDGPAIHLEHLHRYQLAAAVVDGAVIDLGCGVGYGSRLLAAAADRVVGIDLSAAALRFAAATFAAPGLGFAAADARATPWSDGTFDWAVCFELIEHVADGERLVAEARRLLGPHGCLLLSTPNRVRYTDERGYRNPFHVREMDRGELVALLGAHFEEVTLFGQEVGSGSFTWPLDGRAGDGARPAAGSIYRLEPGSDAPEAMRPRPDPIYLVALCGPAGSAELGAALAASVLSARLEPFLEERDAEHHERLAAVQETFEGVVGELRQRLGEFDQRIRALGNGIEQVQGYRQREVADLEARLGRATAEAGDLQGRLEAADSAREEAEAARDEAEQARDRLCAELKAAGERRAELEAEHDRLHAEAQEIADLGARVQADRDRLRSELREIGERTAGLEAEREALGGRVKAAEGRVAVLERERDRHAGRSDKLAHELAGRLEELARAGSELEETRGQLEEAARALTDGERRLAALDGELAAARRESGGLRGELDRVQSEAGGLRQRLEAERAAVERLQGDLAAATGQRDAVRADHDRLAAELARIEGTRLWRLRTALGRLLGRGRREEEEVEE